MNAIGIHQQAISSDRRSRWGFKAALALAAAALTLSLAGCLTAHDVDLVDVWDTEAAEELTNQKDVTNQICGQESTCVEALRSDQGLFLKFASADDAASERKPGDDLVREIFLLRWEDGVSPQDRDFAILVLENSLKSGD